MLTLTTFICCSRPQRYARSGKLDFNSIRKASLKIKSYLKMDWATLEGDEFSVFEVV